MNMKSSEKVINKVSEMRKLKNITQEQLAEACGVTRQTVIAIEKGNYIPSVLLALKISRFFKKPLETLFFY
jgi:putative transcriptional regulator